MDLPPESLTGDPQPQSSEIASYVDTHKARPNQPKRMSSAKTTSSPLETLPPPPPPLLPPPRPPPPDTTPKSRPSPSPNPPESSPSSPNTTHPTPNPHTHLYQKSNLSSSSSSSCSSSSSTRLIPTRVLSFPKINHPHHPQSAPVNVPVQMRPGGGGRRNNDRELDETKEEELGDGEMLPPHVIVALSHTPAMACSVLEGAGRTLKGRDLRQVRNAVWRRTGFLD